MVAFSCHFSVLFQPIQYSHYKEWIKNCGRLLSLFDTLSPRVLYNFKSPSKSIKKKQFCLNILIESPKKKHFNTAALKQETDKKHLKKDLIL